MKKIIEYKILYKPHPSLLDEEVNESLRQGWELYGSPFIDKELYVHQTMVKYEDSMESLRDAIKYGQALNYENK